MEEFRSCHPTKMIPTSSRSTSLDDLADVCVRPDEAERLHFYLAERRNELRWRLSRARERWAAQDLKSPPHRCHQTEIQSKSEKLQAIAELAACKRRFGESVADFADRVADLHRRAYPSKRPPFSHQTETLLMDRFVLGLGERLRRSLRNDAGGEIHAGVVPGRGRLQDLVQAAVEYEIYDEPSDCITHY